MKQKILKLTKLDAAKCQLDTAVWLWFHEGDPVSIHTLTGAANRIILDLSERQGETCLPFDMMLVTKGREKEAKKLLRKAETFFKHAKDDPDAMLDFNPTTSEMYLFFTVLGYKDLTKTAIPLHNLFIARFLFIDDYASLRGDFEKHLSVFPADSGKKSKKDFFDAFFPLIPSLHRNSLHLPSS